MKKVCRVLYVGDDSDYIVEGIRYFKHISTKAHAYEYLTINPAANLALYPLLKNNDCLLVILDFTHHGVNQNHLMNQLRHIKNHRFLRQIAFVGLFKDKTELEDSKCSLMYGLTYLHVKGNEITQFLRDCAYIAFESKVDVEYFARVKNLALPYQLSMLGFVSEIHADGFKLNCDLEETSEEIKVSHTFFGKPMTDLFPVEQNYDGAGVGNFLTSFELLFPFLNRWEATADDLQRETVEDWIREYPLLRQLDRAILVWTCQDELFGQLMLLELPPGYTLHLNQSTPISKVLTSRPEIIVLDLNHDQDIMHDLIGLINSSEKEAVLLIFNSPYESLELKQKLNYEKLICYSYPCDLKIVESLIKLYFTKNTSNPTEERPKSFCPTDLNGHVTIDVPIIVTSLTEHELTFLHKSELAMFSILRLDVPVNCYVLIIPSYWALDKKEHYHHHMGLIMGIDHEDSTLIRSFVNQAIFTPLKNFERPSKTKVPIETQTPLVKQETNQETQMLSEAVDKEFVSGRRNTYRRSKL